MTPPEITQLAARGRSLMARVLRSSFRTRQPLLPLLHAIMHSVMVRGRMCVNLEPEGLDYVLRYGLYRPRPRGPHPDFTFHSRDFDIDRVEGMLGLTAPGVSRPIYLALTTGGGGLRSYGPISLVLSEGAANRWADETICLIENCFNRVARDSCDQPVIQRPFRRGEVSFWRDRALLAGYKRLKWVRALRDREGIANALHPTAPWVCDHLVLSSGGHCNDDYIECLLYTDFLPLSDFGEIRMYTEMLPTWLNSSLARDVARRAPKIKVSFVDSSRALGAFTPARHLA